MLFIACFLLTTWRIFDIYAHKLSHEPIDSFSRKMGTVMNEMLPAEAAVAGPARIIKLFPTPRLVSRWLADGRLLPHPVRLSDGRVWDNEGIHVVGNPESFPDVIEMKIPAREPVSTFPPTGPSANPAVLIGDRAIMDCLNSPVLTAMTGEGEFLIERVRAWIKRGKLPVFNEGKKTYLRTTRLMLVDWFTDKNAALDPLHRYEINNPALYKTLRENQQRAVEWRHNQKVRDNAEPDDTALKAEIERREARRQRD
jgi:hypothetical protein